MRWSQWLANVTLSFSFLPWQRNEILAQTLSRRNGLQKLRLRQPQKSFYGSESFFFCLFYMGILDIFLKRILENVFKVKEIYLCLVTFYNALGPISWCKSDNWGEVSHLSKPFKTLAPEILDNPALRSSPVCHSGQKWLPNECNIVIV